MRLKKKRKGKPFYVTGEKLVKLEPAGATVVSGIKMLIKQHSIET